MRVMAVILGAIGIAVAAGNVWAFFIQWLSLLGILVPPIGAIILIDQYVFRRTPRSTQNWRPGAFIAWGNRLVCAFIVEEWMPYLRLRSRPPLARASLTTSSPDRPATSLAVAKP